MDGEEWGAGERWDWGPVERGGLDLRPSGRSYGTSFRTHPDPDASGPLDVVVLGDYSVGVMSDSESSRRQSRVAEVLDRLVDRHGVRLVIGVATTSTAGRRGSSAPRAAARTTTGTPASTSPIATSSR